MERIDDRVKFFNEDGFEFKFTVDELKYLIKEIKEKYNLKGKVSINEEITDRSFLKQDPLNMNIRIILTNNNDLYIINTKYTNLMEYTINKVER